MTDKQEPTDWRAECENLLDVWRDSERPYDHRHYVSGTFRKVIKEIEAKLAAPPVQPHGCHCDLEPHMQPDGCVFDTDRIADCVYAGILSRQGKGKTDCKYWQPIKIAPPAQPAAPDDVAGCLACVTCGQPAPAQPDTAAQEREHMGDPDKRTGIYAAPAQRLSDEQQFADMVADASLRVDLAASPFKLLAFARAVEAAICPPGCVVVPVEPTDEMVEAAWDSDAADYVGEHKRIWQVAFAYRAMIAAAKDKP